MTACPACGSENTPSAKFCAECGARLAAAAASLAAERKVVTALFCDLVGSTELADGADPEDIDRLLRGYHALAKHRIESFGGTVEKFIGDAVVGVFGVPAAHEDDPERAVRAGLRIVEEVAASDLGLHVRVGVMTGETLVRGDLDPSAGEGLATGDTLNIAARLQVQAPIDGVLAGEPTHRACARTFTWEDVGPLALKGRAEPLGAWRALAPVARLVAEPPEEATPFVGRDHELATLVRSFERSRATPTLEVVTIVADPGFGKSRLVRELGRYVDGLPDPVTWRVGRCLPYGEGIGFWALSEIVKAQAGILDTDDQATLGAKLDAALTEPEPSLRRWMHDRLGPLVGLETGAEPPQADEAYTAWRRFLEAIAAAGPLVLVVEDLHWADEGFVSFLQHLTVHTVGLPVTLLVTARPELAERQPSWLARGRRTTVLSLDALADRDAAALVEGTLPGATPELVATILERAAGSPLYAEQLVAMVVERPGHALVPDAIPPTLQGLLAARIDALPPPLKPALLDASVVGKTFWAGAVARLGSRSAEEVEPVLAELAARELVRPTYPSSMAGEAEHTFWHALLSDVAYGELTRAARLAKHRTAAAWIAERSGGARGPKAELVAAHLERALELAAAIGASEDLPAVRDSLADALLGSADHALATRPTAASGFAGRALELLGPDDPRRPVALVARGRALLTAREFAAATAALDEADALLRARGDDLAAARLAPPRYRALVNGGDFERAVAVLATARTALAADPSGDLVTVIAEQAMVATLRNDSARSIELASEAIELAASLGLPRPYRALSARGSARYGTEPDVGEADLLAAIHEAEAAGDLYAAATASMNRAFDRLNTLGVAAGIAAADEAVAFCAARGLPTENVEGARLDMLVAAGRWDEATELAGRLHDWATAHGDAWTKVAAARTMAVVALGRGEPTGPLDALAALGRATGATASWYGAPVAEGFLARGDAAGARRVIEETLGSSAANALDTLADLVRVSLRAGSPALARRALELGGTRGPAGAADSRTAEAELAEVEGRTADARAAYEEAIEAFHALGQVLSEAEALLSLGRCLLALGETEQGVARLREARERWVGMRSIPRITEIDELVATAGA